MGDNGFSITTITPAGDYPITLAEAKKQIREDITDQDARITSYIAAATERCQVFTERAFVTQTLQLTIDAFPPNLDPFFVGASVGTHEDEVIIIPRPRLIEIDSVKYMDTDGTLQTLAASKYQVDTNHEPGRLAPAYGEVWPDTRSVFGAVRIQFQAGYGAASAVPASVKQAIQMLVGHYFENREHVVLDGSPKELPEAVHELLWSNRVYEIR